MDKVRRSSSGNLSRSKSTGCLNIVSHDFFYKNDYYNMGRRLNESSEVYGNDTGSEGTVEDKLGDSGIHKSILHAEALDVMGQKFERLSDLFQAQCTLLTEIKDEIRTCKATTESSEHMHMQVFSDLMKKALDQGLIEWENSMVSVDENECETNTRARTLLDAIEFQRANHALHRAVKNAITNFLQSEELRNHMVSTTVESLKEMVNTRLTQDVSSVYMPLLERLHRRLLKHVTRVLEDAFLRLEEHSSACSRSVYSSAKWLRRALLQHQSTNQSDNSVNLVSTMRHVMQDVLQTEVKQWRQKVLTVLSLSGIEREEEEIPPSPDYGNLPQPGNPERSITDQLMMSAEINMKLFEGDVNGSFEKALSASDLSIVMCACRAADPAKVFAPPCLLEQSVLLSLVQQLATDMVHETQLKCRYLEDALINLNTSHPATRAYLPMVIGEVRTHLKKFLQAYPSHVASRRITLIVMAANNLLK